MRRIDLGERPTSREELSAWYAAALDAQAASGLGVTAYAEQLGVSAWTLYQWRRRLSSSKDSKHRRTNLVEVTIARTRSTAVDGCLVVRVHDGRRSIEVPRGFEAEELRRLIAVLESC